MRTGFAAIAAILIAGSAFAGSLDSAPVDAPVMAPAVVVEESSGSSAGGVVVPLLLLLVAAAVAS